MDEEHYEDYLNQLSNLSVELSLFSGFTFTTITILLTMLPDPSTILAQVALFFLVVLLDTFIFLGGWVMTMRTVACRYLPFKSIPGSKIFNPLLFLSYCLWGIGVALMFMLCNLYYLSMLSMFVWTVLVIVATKFFWKQFREYYRKKCDVS